MEERLELMAAIGSDGADSEREFLYYVIDKVDGIGLRVATIDLQCANSRRIINGRVLKRRTGAPFFRVSVRNFTSTCT